MKKYDITSLKPIITLACVLAGLFLAVAFMARITWFLSGAGRIDFAGMEKIPAPKRHGSESGKVHKVGEWEGARTFQEAPSLRVLSQSGKIPPVKERLPENPLVIVPPQQIGPYGGSWARLATSSPDIGLYQYRIAYEGFVRWDDMGQNILPNLAVRWLVEDDAKTFTFFLRRGIRWSDGEPYTVDDILFWYEHIIKNKELTPVPPRELIRGGELGIIEKVDDYTVRFRFKEPYGLFLPNLASGFSMWFVEFPAHYLKQFHVDFVPKEKLEAAAKDRGFDFWYQIFWDKGEWRNPDHPRLWAWLIKIPPPGRPCVFERNPYFWKVDPEGNQLPYIDKITFDIYEMDTINLKAMNGEVGMQGRHIAFENYPLFMENREKGGYRALHWLNAGGGSLSIGLNMNHKDPVMRKIIGDKRFRQALSHAINRNDLNEVCFFGVGEPRQMSPPPTSPFYSAKYEKAFIEYDPDKANALLDEMGLSKRDRNGNRLRPDGKLLKLYIETPTTFISNKMQELIAQDWTAVGVNSEVKMEARQLFYTRKAACLHDVGVWGASDEQLPIMDPRWFFPFNTESIQGIAYARWFATDGKRGEKPPLEIKRCMDLYRQIEKTSDLQKQVALFDEILELNAEHLWVLGVLGNVPVPFLVKNNFRNVPEVAISGWIFRTPGNTAPECYAMEE
ncbi:ABC transporter substrate-binding protein [Candidatus Sumerlaeota bacterium]|nr:ABC transporter substrate-binding protein [Candidatus Sumerlaeota bacterium]